MSWELRARDTELGIVKLWKALEAVTLVRPLSVWRLPGEMGMMVAFSSRTQGPGG